MKKCISGRMTLLINDIYSGIAEQYDIYFTSGKYHKENLQLFHNTLRIDTSDTILDIGCGTGILLDYIEIDSSQYFGIDPSESMLHVFRKKHPEYEVQKTLFENFQSHRKFTVILALWGAPNYINPDKINRIYRYKKSSQSKIVLMYYNETYQAETHKHFNISPNVQSFHPPSGNGLAAYSFNKNYTIYHENLFK